MKKVVYGRTYDTETASKFAYKRLYYEDKQNNLWESWDGNYFDRFDEVEKNRFFSSKSHDELLSIVANKWNEDQLVQQTAQVTVKQIREIDRRRKAAMAELDRRYSRRMENYQTAGFIGAALVALIFLWNLILHIGHWIWMGRRVGKG